MSKRSGHWGPKVCKIQKPTKALAANVGAAVNRGGSNGRITQEEIDSMYISLTGSNYVDSWGNNVIETAPTPTPPPANRDRAQQLYERLRSAATPARVRVTTATASGTSIDDPF